MFHYFPDNYAWSNIVQCALSLGGEIGEIHQICEPLKAIQGEKSADANAKSFEAWLAMAERVESLAERDESLGNKLSASRKYFRATVYYLFAEMQTTMRSDKKIPTYLSGQRTFKKGVTLAGEKVEWVDVPYEGTTLPGLFVPAKTDRMKAPCVVHFDGFDWNKELMYALERQDMA
ncbi:MAG: alpha/beta hydrolase, partial [Caulobacterales bacterium]|nr:alpha/beta hydrolase [Caulobacterales bacterium]